MSGFTPVALSRFRDMLGARGLRIEDLAEQVGTTRSYLSRVLNGHLVSGDTRKRIHALTTADEWATLCTLEHFATWNSEQDAAGAGELPWLMVSECMFCHEDRRFVPCCRSSARELTHGICPACTREHFGDDAPAVLELAAKISAAA